MNKNNNYQLGETEQKLQDYILSQYKSVREFCMQIDRPYSTISNMLKRGLLNSSVDLVLYVVDCLGLDVDELFSGRIIQKSETSLNPEITKHEINIIKAYRAKPEMQAAVDKLLGVESGDTIIEDMNNTVEQGEKNFKKNTIGTK